ncbi:ribonuclease H-like domain-containing protein [Candidatus Bathyarchaeota archaeon]|nr:ribonuclease H-like domain-containing protein [Candidatus Bathyarchaeota archaeon]
MNIVVFDLETQNLFEDVGGRNNIGALKVSCAVTWSSIRNDFTVYWEKDVLALITELKSAGRVVGFNIKGFDYEVLRPYAPDERLQFLPTLDIMDDLFHALSFRVSLDAVARATLGDTKSASGVQAVEWWRAGELEKLAEYCKVDVDVTRRIYEFGCANGYVHYFTRLGSKQKVQVKWKC